MSPRLVYKNAHGKLRSVLTKCSTALPSRCSFDSQYEGNNEAMSYLDFGPRTSYSWTRSAWPIEAFRPQQTMPGRGAGATQLFRKSSQTVVFNTSKFRAYYFYSFAAAANLKPSTLPRRYRNVAEQRTYSFLLFSSLSILYAWKQVEIFQGTTTLSGRVICQSLFCI